MLGLLASSRNGPVHNSCWLAGATVSNDVHSILNAVAHGRVDVSDAVASIEEISSGLHVRTLNCDACTQCARGCLLVMYVQRFFMLVRLQRSTCEPSWARH